MMLRKIIMKKAIFLLFFVLFSLFYNNKAKCEEKFVKRIVVMPFENLTGNKTAVKLVQGEIINELRNKGYEIVAEDDVKKFYLNEGLRYTKYVTPDITKKMKEKMNVEAVLLGVLTSYSEKTERMGIYLTLVDAEECRILWVNHVSFTTQDYAKLLGIKPFSTFEEFRRMVIRELLKDFQESNFMKNERFYKVVVLPFVNKTNFKNANIIVTYLFIESLYKKEDVEPVYLGLVKDAFIKNRILNQPFYNKEILLKIAKELGVDYIILGSVDSYVDAEFEIVPETQLSVRVFDAKYGKLVWYDITEYRGDQDIKFFDFGKIRTAENTAYKAIVRYIDTMRKVMK